MAKKKKSDKGALDVARGVLGGAVDTAARLIGQAGEQAAGLANAALETAADAVGTVSPAAGEMIRPSAATENAIAIRWSLCESIRAPRSFVGPETCRPSANSSTSAPISRRLSAVTASRSLSL